MISNSTEDTNDKEDEYSVHQSIPTLGDERIILEIPDFEEAFIELPTLEELDEQTRKELEELSKRELDDQTRKAVSSTELPIMKPNQNDSPQRMVHADVNDPEADKEIETILFAISRMLADTNNI